MNNFKYLNSFNLINHDIYLCRDNLWIIFFKSNLKIYLYRVIVQNCLEICKYEKYAKETKDL